MAPSSRLALSLKPSVAYLVLNLCPLWKKQTTLPSSLAYAGIPYQVLGVRLGAAALTMACSRSAMARSWSGISAIFASTSLSPSVLVAREPRRAADFTSWARSLIAARSSSVNPLDAFLSAILPSSLRASCGPFTCRDGKRTGTEYAPARGLTAADHRCESRCAGGPARIAGPAPVCQRGERVAAAGSRAPRCPRHPMGRLCRGHAGRVRDDRRRGRRAAIHPALPVEAADRRAPPAEGLRHRNS